MTLPIYKEVGYNKPIQRETARHMNVLLHWLHNQKAPADVQASARYVVEELALWREIEEEE